MAGDWRQTNWDMSFSSSSSFVSNSRRQEYGQGTEGEKLVSCRIVHPVGASMPAGMYSHFEQFSWRLLSSKPLWKPLTFVGSMSAADGPVVEVEGHGNCAAAGLSLRTIVPRWPRGG